MAMLAGAATGINAGFLSAIAGDVRLKAFGKESTLFQVDESSVYVLRNAALRHFEMLHIPVVFGSIFLCFCIVFVNRFPRLRDTRLVLTTALCGACMITLTVSVLSAEQENSVASSDLVKIFTSMFVLAFLSGMLPMVCDHQRPWIICVLVFVLNVMWQSRHLDCLMWDWKQHYYPIPGSITGMMLIFLINVSESGAPDSEFSGVEGLTVEEVAYLKSKDKLSPRPSDRIIPIEVVGNAFLWHTLTYIVERLSLAFIQYAQQKRDVSAFVVPHGSDVWISCVCLLAFLAVTSPYFKAGSLVRLLIVLVGLLYYLTMTMHWGIFTNEYFLNMIFGMTLVYLSCALNNS